MNNSSIPKRKGKIRREPFGGLIFCISPNTIITLNHTGYCIARMLDGSRQIDQIAAYLHDVYIVSLETALRDIRQMVQMLDSASLIDWKCTT